MTRAERAPQTAAALGVLGLAAWVWPYTVDDAFILARYAERLTTGSGWTFVDGDPTDGVTSLLFGGLVSIGVAAGASPVTLAKALGLLSTAAGAFLAVGACRPRASAWLSAAFVSLNANLVIWSIGGLETGLATLLFTTAWRTSGTRYGPALCAGTLAWVRPELTAAALVFVARPVFEGVDRFRVIAAGAIVAALSLSLIVFRIITFGSPLPLAIIAKPPDVFHGIEYSALGMLVVMGGFGVVLLALAARVSSSRWLFIAVAIHLGVVALLGGDWMPGFRLITPVVPAMAYLAATGVAQGWVRGPRRWPLVILVVLTVMGLAIDLATQMPRARDAAMSQQTRGADLADDLSAYSTVALVDIGYLAWRGGFNVVDLGGLVDPVVSRFPGGHVSKRIDAGFLSHRAPDAIVVHSRTEPTVSDDGTLVRYDGFPVEHRVTSLNYVRDSFRVARVVQYSDSYWYVVLDQHHE